MARRRISPARPDDTDPSGPVRTCIGCRTRAPKSELLRVTAVSDVHGMTAVLPDPRATAPGRGAHLHPTTECYDLAVRRRAFFRALRVPDRGSAVGAGPFAAAVGEFLSSHRP